MFKDLSDKNRENLKYSSAKGLNEDIFRKIVEASPTAIVLINKEGKIVLVNAQTEKLFGYSREELTGHHVEQLIPDRFRKNHSEYRDLFVSRPSARPMGAGRDLYGLHKNGTEIPVEIGLSPFQSGDDLYTLGSIIDITERKRAEHMFRQVVESSPNAIILVDGDGKIVLVNLQMELLLGYKRNELMGETIDKIIPERFRYNMPALLNEYFKNPVSSPIDADTELYGLRKDGTEVPVEIGLTPIETEQGLMVLGSIIDITEIKRLAAKRREEEAQSEQHARELIRLAELERFQKLTVGRELKMIELKKEIEELKNRMKKLEGNQ